MRQLLEAGVHRPPQTHRWNPKMAPFIYGERNNIHILDLSQTVPLLNSALKVVFGHCCPRRSRSVRWHEASGFDIIADAANRSAQYYVNARWLGGDDDQLEDDLQLDPASAQARRTSGWRSPKASPRRNA